MSNSQQSPDGGRRWKHRPDGSNWGEFGMNDQVGRLNLLTPETIKRAAKEVREGIAFCLSLPLDCPGGDYHQLRRARPELRAIRRGGAFAYNHRADPEHTDVWCDDAVLLYPQASTQWDALAHVGSVFDADGDGIAEKVYYNGFRAENDIRGPANPAAPDGAAMQGATALGIENMATTCVQGRGVLVDLLSACGTARSHVGYDQFMRICEQDGIEFEAGDILLLHTGLADALLKAGAEPSQELLENSHAGFDAHDERLLRWITDSGIAAIAADNFAIETVPGHSSAPSTALEPLHEHCIFKLGVHLGELWHLTPLADWMRHNGRNRCFLTAAPLRLPGAVGSPVTPVATV